MKKTLLNIGFLLASTTLVFGQWVKKSDFPDGVRTAAVSFVIGNDAYVGTGRNNNDAVLRDFWKYNSVSDTWVEIASLPAEAAAREGATAFSIDGKGYIGLGSDGTQSDATEFYQDFWMYEPSTNQWTAIASFPGNGRKDAIAFVIDGKAYVGAGYRPIDSGYDSDYQYDFWEYNPAANEWIKRKNAPNYGGANAVTFVIDGIGYFGTGTYVNGSTATTGSFKDDLFSYSSEEDKWTNTITENSILSREGATAFVVDGKAYIGGGLNHKDFVVYDPIKNTLKDTVTFISDTEGRRANMISFVINGTAYAGLGDRGTKAKQADIWAIQLAEPSSAPILTSGTSTSRSLQLIWNSQADLYTSFILERSTDGAQFTSIGTFKDTAQFLDTHLAENTQYYYRIIGNKADNTTEVSDIISARTRMHTPQSFAIIPDSNSPIPANNSATEVYLHWINESAFATHVVIEKYDESDTKFIAIATVPVEEMPFTDTGLSAGVTYQYRIKATNGALSSLYSNTVSTTLRETVALSAPSNLAVDYQDSIALTWQHDDPYTTHFLVERSQGEATDFQQIDSVSRSFPIDTFFSYDATVEEITQYHYRIIASTIYDDALSACSDTITITTPLYSPTALVVSQQDSSLSLSWQDQSEKETAYVIERSISQDSILSDNSSYVAVDSVGVNIVIYKDTVALQDGYYHYRIKAISNIFTSGYLYGKVKVTVKKEGEGNGGGEGEGGEGGPVTDLPQDIKETPITIYPNPSVRHLLIKAPVRMESIVLYNSRGVVLKKITDQALLSPSGVSLDVSSLTSGMYIVQVQTSEGMATKRIIKQ